MLTDITELDYSNFLSNGKSNFVLNQFQQSDTNIYGEATYINNNVQMSIVQEYYANGTYQYILTYEFPTELGSDYVQIAQSGLQMTRIFYSSEKETEINSQQTENTSDSSQNKDSTQGSESSNSVFVPDSLETEQSQTQSEAPQEQTSQPQTNEEVSTFTDALMSVANISSDTAANISSVWDSLHIGTLTYAQAVKESDTSLIIMVTNDQNANFYIFLGKDGILQEIHAGTEDGEIIYKN